MGLNKTTKALLIATTAFVSSPVTSIASELGGRRRYVKPGYNNEINKKKIEGRIGKRRIKIPISDSNPKSVPGKRVMKEVKQ